MPNIQALAKTSTEAAQKAKDYETRLKAINNEFGQLSAARPEIRAAEVQKAQDELAAAETASDRRIADIRQAGLDKLGDIEQKYSDGRSEALAKENDTIAKANQTERKAIADGGLIMAGGTFSNYGTLKFVTISGTVSGTASYVNSTTVEFIVTGSTVSAQVITGFKLLR